MMRRQRPRGWIRLIHRSRPSATSACAGTLPLTAWSQRLTVRGIPPAARRRWAASSSAMPGRTKIHTVNAVSRPLVRARASGVEITGRCAVSDPGMTRATRAAARDQRPRARRLRGMTASGGFGELAKTHADDGRDAGFLHRHAVDGVGGLHRAGIVRDDDELRLTLELRKQPDVTPHVGVVERGVHLVEQAERAGAG